MVSERRKSALVLCVVDVSWGEKEIEEIKKGVQWQLQTKRCKSASIIILLPTECEGSGLDCSLRREVASLGKSIQLKVSYLPTPFNKEDHSRQLEPYFTKIIYTTFIYCSSGTFEVLKDNNVFPVIEVIPNSDGGDDSYYRVFQTELDNYPNPNYISIVGDTLPSYTSEVELKTFEKFVNTKLPELPIRSCLLDVVSFFGSSDSCSNSKKILTVAACTGSGKSTQIPVALLKWYQIHRKPVRIAVIMPRRLTVSNVYKTVSQSEAMKGRSELIGFKIGSQHYNPNAQLVFQTVGCFVNDLIFRAQEESQVDNQKLFPYSHIIIDEYHLKSAEMELLCGIVRHEYFTSGKSFHILGMTATMSKSHLLLSKEQQLPSQIPNYLHEISLNTSISRQFVVEKKDLSYLSSDLSSIEAETRFCVEGDTAALKTVTGENAEKEQLVRAVEGRLDLISDIIDLFIKTVPSCRVVLIFLPGIAAIRSAEKQLRSCSRRRYSVLKLHSSLKHENSIVTCGLPSDEESHSVILATNTAELGVTLPEVDLLIDSCLERVVCGGGLKTDLCSLDSLVQREGRVGRCKNGIAVKLLFRSEFGILLNESSSQLQQQVPESTLLAALTFGSAAGVSLIKLFSTVNWEEDAENNEEQKLLLVALHNLLSMGAACKRKDKVGTNIYTLTDTGVFLQLLPVDPKIGQLIGKARYLGSDELQLSIETSVCCSVSPLQLCGSQAFVLNAANSSNSSVISSVNILHFYRSLKYISEDETELRQRSEEFSILVDGCEELLQKMADICSILSRYDLFVSPPTACLPLSHREMITISVLFAITFRRSLFAYVPPSVDFTAGRFADIPVGFVKRYSVALKESLSKQQIEELTACRVNKVSGGSKVKTKLAGDDKEPTKFPHKVKKEKDKQKSAKTEAKDKKEKRGKRRKVCYCEMEMSSAVATVWDRPNAVWMMERRGLGVSGTCGKLKPIFKSSSPPPRILFDPILLPASELHPPEECPAVIREVFGPLIVTATEFGDCVLPASVAGLLSVVLLLSEKFVCSRKQERIDPPEALFKKLLISVEGFSGISVSTSSVTSAFSSPDFMLTFNSVYNALNHGVRSDNFGDLIDHLLMSSRRDQVLAGFSGSASIWRNDSSFVDLFPTCFQSCRIPHMNEGDDVEPDEVLGIPVTDEDVSASPQATNRGVKVKDVMCAEDSYLPNTLSRRSSTRGLVNRRNRSGTDMLDPTAAQGSFYEREGHHSRRNSISHLRRMSSVDPLTGLVEGVGLEKVFQSRRSSIADPPLASNMAAPIAPRCNVLNTHNINILENKIPTASQSGSSPPSGVLSRRSSSKRSLQVDVGGSPVSRDRIPPARSYQREVSNDALPSRRSDGHVRRSNRSIRSTVNSDNEFGGRVSQISRQSSISSHIIEGVRREYSIERTSVESVRREDSFDNNLRTSFSIKDGEQYGRVGSGRSRGSSQVEIKKFGHSNSRSDSGVGENSSRDSSNRRHRTVSREYSNQNEYELGSRRIPSHHSSERSRCSELQSERRQSLNPSRSSFRGNEESKTFQGPRTDYLRREDSFSRQASEVRPRSRSSSFQSIARSHSASGSRGQEPRDNSVGSRSEARDQIIESHSRASQSARSSASRESTGRQNEEMFSNKLLERSGESNNNSQSCLLSGEAAEKPKSQFGSEKQMSEDVSDGGLRVIDLFPAEGEKEIIDRDRDSVSYVSHSVCSKQNFENVSVRTSSGSERQVFKSQITQIDIENSLKESSDGQSEQRREPSERANSNVNCDNASMAYSEPKSEKRNGNTKTLLTDDGRSTPPRSVEDVVSQSVPTVVTTNSDRDISSIAKDRIREEEENRRSYACRLLDVSSTRFVTSRSRTSLTLERYLGSRGREVQPVASIYKKEVPHREEPPSSPSHIKQLDSLLEEIAKQRQENSRLRGELRKRRAAAGREPTSRNREPKDSFEPVVRRRAYSLDLTRRPRPREVTAVIAAERTGNFDNYLQQHKKTYGGDGRRFEDEVSSLGHVNPFTTLNNTRTGRLRSPRFCYASARRNFAEVDNQINKLSSSEYDQRTPGCGKRNDGFSPSPASSLRLTSRPPIPIRNTARECMEAQRQKIASDCVVKIPSWSAEEVDQQIERDIQIAMRDM